MRLGRVAALPLAGVMRIGKGREGRWHDFRLQYASCDDKLSTTGPVFHWISEVPLFFLSFWAVQVSDRFGVGSIWSRSNNKQWLETDCACSLAKPARPNSLPMRC
jgi:hypothetical protein